MRFLRIPARYYRLYLEEKPYGCGENSFHFVEQELDIPVQRAALVLVDCWSVHYCVSYLSRAEEIIERNIVPALEAAQRVGLVIIHAPSSNVARRYLQSGKYLDPRDKEESSAYASVDPEWPPDDFVRRLGGYGHFARMFSPPEEYWKDKYKDMAIPPLLAPRPEDYVVVSGSHLHRILKRLKILHLFYAGFATNMCLQHRDYGMRAVSERGYNLVLLSDCTTALENHDTLEQLLLTKAFTREIELRYAFSTTLKEFMEACARSLKSE